MKMSEDSKKATSPGNKQNKKLKLPKNENNSSSEDDNSYSSDSDDDVEGVSSLDGSELLENNSETKLKCFRGSNFALIALKKEASVYIFGACKIQVLRGGVNVFGYNIHPSEKMYDLVSSRGSPRLFLTHNFETNVNNNEKIIEIARKSGFNREMMNDIITNYLMNDDYAIICCYPIDNNWIKYIKKCVKVVLFPCDVDKLQASFNSIPDENTLKIGEKWANIIDYQKKDQTVMICGGQGVGKSTLIRYMINTLLNHHEKVYVIDLDPGQAEFTMAGCISIVCIENPIFGPNYATLTETIRSISHNIDVSHSPEHYIYSVQSLLKTYKTLEKYPTLINMAGFHKGLGLEITSSIIVVINPNTLIEIKSEKKQKNYSSSLCIPTVRQRFSSFLPNFEIKLSYKYIDVTSVSDSTGFKPAGYLRRNISTISYFGKIMDHSLTLRSGYIPMYRGNLDEFDVIDKEFKSIDAAIKENVINANIVGLCSAEEGEKNIFNCYGYGVVRSVVNNVPYVISPVNPEILRKVTHFTIGLVELPTSMLDEDEKSYDKPVPYYASGCLPMSQEKPRRNYLPRK